MTNFTKKLFTGVLALGLLAPIATSSVSPINTTVSAKRRTHHNHKRSYNSHNVTQKKLKQDYSFLNKWYYKDPKIPKALHGYWKSSKKSKYGFIWQYFMAMPFSSLYPNLKNHRDVTKLVKHIKKDHLHNAIAKRIGYKKYLITMPNYNEQTFIKTTNHAPKEVVKIVSSHKMIARNHYNKWASGTYYKISKRSWLRQYNATR